MYFMERVNQGESLASWLNWLTEPSAVCWSVIMEDLSASCKGDTGPFQMPSERAQVAVLCTAWSYVHRPIVLSVLGQMVVEILKTKFYDMEDCRYCLTLTLFSFHRIRPRGVKSCSSILCCTFVKNISICVLDIYP